MKEKILRQNENEHGYLTIGLRKDKKRVTRIVHRIIAMAFIPNPENKPEVNHKNGNKLDNCIENLEWVTSKENVVHAHSLHLVNHHSGLNHHKSRPISQRDSQGKLINIYPSIRSAQKDGYSVSCIIRVCQGELSKHKGYKWAYI